MESDDRQQDGDLQDNVESRFDKGSFASEGLQPVQALEVPEEGVGVLVQTKDAGPFVSQPGSPNAAESSKNSPYKYTLDTPLHSGTPDSADSLRQCFNPSISINDQAKNGGKSLLESEELSYYIVESSPRPRAYYMHKRQGARRQGRYEVELVNVDTDFTKGGHPALLVKLSRTQMGELPTQRPSLATSGEMEDKARKQIESRRLENCQLQVIDINGNHVNDDRKKYLIDDSDIRNLVDAIGDAARQDSAPQLRSVAQSDSAPPRLTPPTLDSASIVPPPAYAADPALTVSSPTTSYATVNPTNMKVQTRTRDAELRATATIVTRNSVAEVTWSGDGQSPLDSYRPSPNRVSSNPIPRTTSSSLSTNSSQVSGPITLSLHHYEALASLIDLVKDLDVIPSIVSGKNQNGMISFPELLTRHCTNEWLTPPVSDQQLVAPPPTDDMYLQGVDAHSGVKRPSIAEHEEPQKPFHCNYTFFDNNPFANEEHEFMHRRASVSTSTLGRDITRGKSIGVSAHRRRSTQPLIEPGHLGTQGVTRTLMDRLRKGGHKMFHRNRSHHKGSDNHNEMTPAANESVMEEGSESTADLLSGDNMVIHMDPASPGSESHMGIYRGSSGKRLSVGYRGRKNTCSEDNQPHVCMVDGGDS